MSREYAQNQQVVYDLFGRDSGGYPTAHIASKADQNETELQAETMQEESAMKRRARTPEERAKVKPQFSEELWEDALRRHCDARQNLRNLLDRYIKPHH